jgi:hypothetical protein
VALVCGISPASPQDLDVIYRDLQREEALAVTGDASAALALTQLRQGKAAEAATALKDASVRSDLLPQVIRALALKHAAKTTSTKNQVSRWRNRYRKEAETFDWPRRVLIEALLHELDEIEPLSQ